MNAPQTPEKFETHFKKIAPANGYGSRMWSVLMESARYRLGSAIGSLPGLGSLKKPPRKPKLQILHSGSTELLKWYNADYGSPEKPQSLAEMPWEYIEEHQEQIPFFGLREFWYPAMTSDELRSDKPSPVRMLGDELVFFRDAEGNPAALHNKCPHRSPLLSLGQVNVFEPGTITCRYHGMTFDKEGSCVAFLADGPNSPACGKGKVRAYPAEEYAGIVWVYMGVKSPPPLLESLPPGREEIFGEGVKYCMKIDVPYSYLNLLDNTVDMTHVGCLHRTCFLFGDQKLGGGVKFEELENGGLHASLREEGGHGGGNYIDEIRWYPPNLVHHGNELLEGGMNAMWFWVVPKDAGSFVGWQIGNFNQQKLGWFKSRMMRKIVNTAFLSAHRIPTVACFEGGDGPIQMAQGRVPRWDQERLSRTDRAVVRVRSIMQNLHQEEIELRRSLGLDPLPHRVRATRHEIKSDLAPLPT